MKFVKKVTKHQLFLPLFSMVLVMLVNIIYDVANGNAVFNFFTISINNGITKCTCTKLFNLLMSFLTS